MGHVLRDSTFTLVRHLTPKLQKSCKDWAMCTVICGIGSEATISGHVPVYDAVAPPSVRMGSYRVAPRSLAYKARRIKKRSHGGEGPGDDDGPEWDEGRFGGSGGWSGSDNGRGGNDYWGASWNEEGGWWENGSGAAFNFIYEVACWISLTQCLQFVLKNVLDLVHHGGVESEGTGAFAQCSLCLSYQPKGASVLADDQMTKLMCFKG